jgi:hypothetical protein
MSGIGSSMVGIVTTLPCLIGDVVMAIITAVVPGLPGLPTSLPGC